MTRTPNRFYARAVGALIVATAVSGCASGAEEVSSTTASSAEATEATATPGTTAAPTTAAPSPATSAVPPATTAAEPRIPMPDIPCGTDLQLAQDTVQSLGIFLSGSEDATGQGRNQVLDNNWTVVGQQPAPGVEIGEGDATFLVVKDEEFTGC